MVSAYPIEHIIEQKKKAIGQRIKRPIGENHVFQIGEYYYKFPNYPRLFHGNKSDYYTLAQQKHQLAQDHFGDIVSIPETKIIPREDSYFIEQKSVQGEPINLQHLRTNPKLISLLTKLSERNDILRKNHEYALDICGTDIISDPTRLHNILTDGTYLYPIDTVGLLEKGGGNIIYNSLSQGIVPLQRKIIQAFLHLAKI